MLIAVDATLHALIAIVQTVPIGTNLGLVQVLWVMVSGRFLPSRGALLGALALGGFEAAAVRRSWAAVRGGAWQINELLENWRQYVLAEGRWAVRRHEGYEAVSVDMTGFWRPRLRGWGGRHFNTAMQKLLPAVVFGVIVRPGQVGAQRVPLLTKVLRCDPTQTKADFRLELLRATVTKWPCKEVVVADAEFGVDEMQTAAVKYYVVRLPSNCALRRNKTAPYCGKGRQPVYGPPVLPVARHWKTRSIAATPPDQTATFQDGAVTITVSFWHDLVPRTVAAGAADTCSVYVFHDPRYRQPLILATTVTDVLPATIFSLYHDRWPVEHPPLAAKQMVGLQRQFVFAKETCYRLPELSLLAGAVLTYLAATLPPVPTAFWDRTPKPTPGRLRRLLAQADFPDVTAFDPQLRKKNAVTAHLPKGCDAHRRKKQAA